MPLDYPPSRALTPRWGYTHPTIATLEVMFAKNVDDYVGFLQYLHSLADHMKTIPIHKQGKERGPSWLDIPMSPLDAAALYGMVRQYKPKTYLEIGSGATTMIADLARKQGQTQTKILSIDPEPRENVDAICDEVVRTGLETAPLEVFSSLVANDIVFLDGSHRSFMNSDVTVFMIDVLPILVPGVIVHVHDVHLPSDYPPMFTNWYWNEQYLLAVYLMGNRDRITPLLPTHYVASNERCRAAIMGDRPLVDFGTDNARWLDGGSMWFTHHR